MKGIYEAGYVCVNYVSLKFFYMPSGMLMWPKI